MRVGGRKGSRPKTADCLGVKWVPTIGTASLQDFGCAIAFLPACPAETGA